jgi:hypothetical protein
LIHLPQRDRKTSPEQTIIPTGLQLGTSGFPVFTGFDGPCSPPIYFYFTSK